MTTPCDKLRSNKQRHCYCITWRPPFQSTTSIELRELNTAKQNILDNQQIQRVFAMKMRHHQQPTDAICIRDQRCKRNLCGGTLSDAWQQFWLEFPPPLQRQYRLMLLQLRKEAIVLHWTTHSVLF